MSTQPDSTPQATAEAPDKGVGCDALLGVREILEDPKAEKCRCIVRLKTSFWKSERGLHTRQDITFMRKLSLEYQVLEEDAANIGAKEVLEKIVNLAECEDGLYEAITCNPYTDWETGYLDDYDYKLVPFSSPNVKDEPRRL